MQYPKDLTDAMQFVWGEGLLSPGGAEEVAQMLAGTDLSGLRVLDIGSGLGGIDILLAEKHNAAAVVGIDVEPPLVESARALAARKGLGGRVDFKLVEPGPFPFPDASFDIVFSKDAMVHIADKPPLYTEIIRVLRPGGRFIGADWFFSEGAATSAVVEAWVSKIGLHFVYTPPATAERALRDAGFLNVEVEDLRHELQVANRREIAFLEGPAGGQLAAIVGAAAAEGRLRSAKGRQGALDSGDLIPCHIRAQRPA